jgi:hypothetical protein
MVACPPYELASEFDKRTPHHPCPCTFSTVVTQLSHWIDLRNVLENGGLFGRNEFGSQRADNANDIRYFLNGQASS